MANNDPVLIPYVIQEGSFWYVAYKERNPFSNGITVSAKGIANHTSEEINDGADFGPDSYDPTSTSKPPYTQSTGILEAYNYSFTQYILDEITGEYQFPPVIIQTGTFHITSPITITPPKITVNGKTYTPGNFTMNGESNTRGSIGTYIYCETPNAYSITIDTSNFSGVNMAINNIVFDFNSNVSGVYGAMTFSNASVVVLNTVNVGNQGATQYSLNISGSQIFLYNFESYGTPSTISATDFIVAYGGVNEWFDRFSAPYVYAPTLNLEARGLTNAVCSGIYFPNDVYGLSNIDTLTLTGRQSLYNQSYTTDIFGTIGVTNNYVMYLQRQQNITINTLILENFRIHNYETSIGQTTLIGSAESGYSITVNKIYYRGVTVSDITEDELIFNTFPLALSANPPVSATVYQNTNPYDIEIDLPVYATTAGTAGYVTIAKGASSTPTAIGNQYVSGDTSSTATQIIRLSVPAGWYYSFTGSGVTFATATPFAE